MKDYRIALEVIRRRRSCRSFREEILPRKVLEEILEAGRWAPSGMNLQKNRLFVLNDPEKVRQMAAIVTTWDERYRDRACTFGAPCLIAVTNRRDNYNAMADGSCIMENMMLAATALGVGSCWINQFGRLSDKAELIELLGLEAEEGEFIVGCLALGYPAQEAPDTRTRTGNRVVWL